jgi:hypothetical protein
MWMGLYICQDCHELYTNDMVCGDSCPECGGNLSEFTYDLWSKEEKRMAGVI